MSVLPARVRRALLLRSFLVQGSWNYETLIGTGFAFVLLPALRHIFGGEPEACRRALARHRELFNSHPYLATVAVGAVARLEAEQADPQVIARFKNALRGSLGSIGDQLFWLVWRPVAGLAGIALLLAGASWWVAVAVFLLVYNVLHLSLRAWGLRVGLEVGMGVGKSLREAPFQKWERRAADVGALLAGLCFTLALISIPGGSGDSAFATVAAVAGFGLGLRIRAVLWVTLTLIWAIGVLAGVFS